MSADNGIYILKLKDQCRVIYATSIENLWYSKKKHKMCNSLVSQEVYEYFCNAKPLSEKDAVIEASRIYNEVIQDDDFGIIEYGIQMIHCDKTWDEILAEAT